MSMNDNDVFDTTETTEQTMEPVDTDLTDDEMEETDFTDASPFSNRDVIEIMRAAREYYNQNLNQATTMITDICHFTPNLLNEAVAFTLDDLENYSDDEIARIYARYAQTPSQNQSVSINDKRDDLISAKKISNSVFQSKAQYESIQDIYRQHVEDNWKKRNSKGSREKQLTEIEELRTAVEATEDPVEKRQMLHKLQFNESILNTSFISDRIRELTEKERSRVIDQFFDEKQGSYCMERMKNRAAKFHLKPDWYKICFNLEENFLPVEYHIYNNLFLYAVTRFIAYADPYNKEDRAMVSAITNNIFALVYHKFDDPSIEALVTQVIMSYDDYFKDYKEKFIKDNTTRPGHPVREAYSKKRELDRKEQLQAALTKFNIPYPETIDTMSANELQEYFNNKVETMMKENTMESKSSTGAASVDETEDVLVVEPSFHLDRYANPVEINDGKFYYQANEDDFVLYAKYLREKAVPNYRFMVELKNPEVPVDLSKDPSEYTDEEKAAIKKEIEDNIYYFARFCFEKGTVEARPVLLFMLYTWDTGIPFYMRVPKGSGKDFAMRLISVYEYYVTHNEQMHIFMVNNVETGIFKHHIEELIEKLYPVVKEILATSLMNESEIDVASTLEPETIQKFNERLTLPADDPHWETTTNVFIDFEYQEEARDILDNFFVPTRLIRGYFMIVTTLNYTRLFPNTNAMLKGETVTRFVTKDDGREKTLFDLFETDLTQNNSEFLYIEIPPTEAYYGVEMNWVFPALEDRTQTQQDLIDMKYHMIEHYTESVQESHSEKAFQQLTEKIEKEGMLNVSDYVAVQTHAVTDERETDDDGESSTGITEKSL